MANWPRPIDNTLTQNKQLLKLNKPDPLTLMPAKPERSRTLMYTMLGMCPDLAYTVSTLSQHTATPGEATYMH